MKRFGFRRGARFLGFAILFIGLAGFAVQLLWNALLPDILGVATINWWQAIGLLALSRILFGGFRGYGPRGYGPRGYGPRGYESRFGSGRFGSSRHEWKQKMAERWQQMTPEQKAQMKQQWRERCGWGRRRWTGDNPEQPNRPSSGENDPDGATS